jgi:hypothetical protein
VRWTVLSAACDSDVQVFETQVLAKIKNAGNGARCNFWADGASIRLRMMAPIKHIRNALLLAMVTGLAMFAGTRPLAGTANSMNPVPVLVELYTSEGCSSCPPADAYLQKLDQQPVAGAEMIVLSEHVDYWNHIGWKDPFSSSFYSDRQSAYGKRFGLGSVYTPQMVVDGSEEFVGSDRAAGERAFAKAVNSQKIAIQLSAISVESANALRAHLEAGPLPSSQGKSGAEVYVVVALNHAESQVARGENAGHRLTHAAVAESMTKVGVMRPGQGFSQDIHLKIESGLSPDNLRLVVFVQEAHQGRVLGATAHPVK